MPLSEWASSNFGLAPIQGLGMKEETIAATIAGHVRSNASFRHCFLHLRWMVERQVELCEDVVDYGFPVRLHTRCVSRGDNLHLLSR
jgi:hypothetical protein